MLISVRKRFGRRVAVLGALTAAIVGVGASSALAAPTLSPAGPYSSSGSTAVIVSGTAPAEASLVAVAVCNASFGAGTHCDLNSASSGGALESVGVYEEEGLAISVRRGATSTSPWTSFDFTTGIPTATTPPTLCRSTSAPGLEFEASCQVEVSFYKTVGGIPTQLGSESKAISFAP